MVFPFEYFAISRAHASTQIRSLALPAPIPFVLVGVFTEIKIISANGISSSIFVEKNKFLPLVFLSIGIKFGS